MPNVNTIKRGGARLYVHPTDARKVPGVTSIVDCLPKPFLTRWASKAAAEFAVKNLAAVQLLVDAGSDDAAVAMLKDAPWSQTRKAARTGTLAHEAFERMALGGSIADALEAAGEDADEVRPFLDHYAAFLDEFQPTFLFLEETVWSDQHLYAGSFDALAEIEGERVWLDNKTTRSGVHDEVALQLSAYANADFILRADGTKVPLPKANKAAVVHVRPEGWSLTPVRIDQDVFDVFLHLREVFDWTQTLHDTVLGAPMNANPSTTPKGKIRAANQRAAAAAAAEAPKPSGSLQDALDREKATQTA